MAAKLQVVCPHCQKKVNLPRSAADSETACPQCRGKIKVLLAVETTEAGGVAGKPSPPESKPAATQTTWNSRKALAMLRDSDPQQRRQAAESLASLGDARNVEPLAEALSDRDPSVRKAAANALEKLGWANSLRRQVALAAAAGDVAKLVSLGHAVTPLLLEMIPRQPVPAQKRLIEVLGQLGDREAVEPLQRLLQQKHLRWPAFQSLVQLADPRCRALCDEFVDTMKGVIADIRATSLKMLDPDQAKAAVGAMQQLLENHSDLVPCELLLQLSSVDRVEAMVSIHMPGDPPVTRTEKQTVRCVAVQKLVMEEIARREVDPKNSGLQQVAAANEAFERQDYTSALDGYSQAIRLNDALAVARHNRGCVYAALEKWDQALVDFNRALAIDPTDFETLLERAKLYHSIGNFERAREDFTAALEFDDGVQALVGRGRVHLDCGQFDKAADDFQLAAERQPDWAILNELGVSLYSRGRFQDAVAQFSASLRRHENVNVLWNRAVAYTARRQFLRALEDLNRIEDLDREFPVHNARGNVLMGLGRHGDAAEEYQRHLERHDNPTTRLNLAIAFQMMHRLDDAVEQYNRVLSAVPELAVAWNNRGLAHRMAGRLDLAIADYNRAVEIDGEHSPAYVNRAMLHRCNGEFEQALRDLEKAIQSEPLNAVAFRNRALVHLRLGSLDHATADYRSAVEIEPALAFSPA